MPQTETKPSAYRRINGKLKSLNLAQATRWSVYFIAIGLIAGLGSIVFITCASWGFITFWTCSPVTARRRRPANTTCCRPHRFHSTADAAVPAGHGGDSQRLAGVHLRPEAEGHGTDAAINAYHNKGGFIRGRVPIIKTIARPSP
jgi:CIC family chloride channel protein